jgi:prepilin-type N-terminal cleavage/methylation domain-containing protein
MFNKNNKKGFTLVELLVVIAIIGLLSTLSIVALNSARTKARDGARIASIKQWQTALELYYSDNNGYPIKSATSTAGSPLTRKGITYYGKLPVNQTPWTGGACSSGLLEYSYKATDSAGTEIAADGNTTYTISYCLEGGAGSVTAGWHTATPLGIQ